MNLRKSFYEKRSTSISKFSEYFNILVLQTICVYFYVLSGRKK